MVIDGEEAMSGDEADYWIMWKAQRSKMAANVYFKGEFIWVGGLPCKGFPETAPVVKE